MMNGNILTNNSGKMLLQKLKDQAREISDLRNFLTELRESVAEHKCECADEAHPCIRCVVLERIKHVH